MDEFIEKWSTWFIFEPNEVELKQAMRKELEQLINQDSKNQIDPQTGLHY